MGETQVINLWTNPRSLSTCLTYAFAQRSDTQVLDEPLHSFYVHTQMSPEAKQLFLAALKSDAQLNIEERDGNKVIDMILDTSGCRKKYRFCKHLAIYFANRSLNPDLLAKSKHIILIRNPIHCLASLARLLPTKAFNGDWTSISYMYSELLKMERNLSIVDAQDLQENPEGTLRALCHALNMEFQPQMLKWEAGPKEFDVYQNHSGSIGTFYQDVHQSTGFLPEPSYWSGKPFPMELYPQLRASWPAYLMLKQQAIKPVSQNPVERKLTVTRQTLVWADNSLVPMEFAPLNQETEDIHETLVVSEHKIFKLKEKISRLREIAQARSLADVPDYKTIKKATFSTAIANGMLDKARLHVTLSRAKGCNCSCMLSVIGEAVEVWDEMEAPDGTDATMIP